MEQYTQYSWYTTYSSSAGSSSFSIGSTQMTWANGLHIAIGENSRSAPGSRHDSLTGAILDGRSFSNSLVLRIALSSTASLLGSNGGT